MKPLLLVLISLILTACATRAGKLADGSEFVAYRVIPDEKRGGFSVPLDWTKDQKRKYVTALGYAYKGMPKQDLPIAGYTRETMTDYYKQGKREFMTFSDYTTPEYGDTITFVIEDGKVKSWFKEKKGKDLDVEM